MPPYRLLAVDIDGTLVNSHDQLTDATRAALVRAAAAGIRIVLVTGRQYSRSLPLARELGLNTPIVTACGALIKDPANHETLYRASFGRGVLSQVVVEIDAAGYESVVYTDDFHAGFEYHYAHRPPRQAALAQFVELNSETGRLRPDLLPNLPEGIFAGFAMGGATRCWPWPAALTSGSRACCRCTCFVVRVILGLCARSPRPALTNGAAFCVSPRCGESRRMRFARSGMTSTISRCFAAPGLGWRWGMPRRKCCHTLDESRRGMTTMDWSKS